MQNTSVKIKSQGKSVKYSIIIPSYNNSKSLRKCLTQLQNQTIARDRYEIIVVDDGSKDDTKKVVESFENIQYFYQENAGPAKARNNGIKMSSGEILLFTDDDCLPQHNWVEQMLLPFKNFPSIAGVKGIYKTEQKSLTAKFAQKEYEDKYDFMKLKKYIDFVDTYSAAYRREIFFKEGMFDEEFTKPSGEDIEFSYRINERGYKLLFNPQAVVYHSHPDNLIQYIKRKFYIAFWRILLYKKHPERVISDSHTPHLLKFQILLFNLFILFAILGIFFKEGLLALSFISIFLFIIATVPFLVKVHPFFLKIFSFFTIIIRTLTFQAGLIFGVIYFLFHKAPKSKTTILQIYRYYFPYLGGIESHILNLVNSTKDRYPTQVLVCNTLKRNSIDYINNVKINRASRLFEIFSLPISTSFLFWFKRIDADIYHYHFQNPLAILVWLFFRPPGKTVITYHMDIVRQKAFLPFFKPFLLKFLKRADVIIAGSTKYKETSEVLNKFRDKIKVVYYGIDTKKFELTSKIENDVQKIKKFYNSPFVLFIGRLIYYKGVNYLIKAMRYTKKDCKLIIIGDGPLKKSLISYTKNLQLEERIFFLGNIFTSELIRFLYASEMLVLPSIYRSEAFGIVLLEAMACSKPLITTEIGTATSEVNIHNKTGLVIPPRNSKAIANAIDYLLENKDVARKMGENGYKRVKKYFTVEHMKENIENIYDTLLK